MVVYVLVNSVALRLTAQFAELLGMGIASWPVVVGIAVVMTAVQGLAAKKILAS
jgi:hypothetical protein